CKEHGYISGEHFACPECGQPAEVYSRITGYYRPVQNWNDGKAQEYRDRRTYDIEHSKMMRGSEEAKAEPQAPVAVSSSPVAVPVAPPAEPVETPAPAEAPALDVTGNILFTTATCPKCKIAKKKLEEKGVSYETVLAYDHKDLCDKFGVRTAPTLIVNKGDGFARYSDLPEVLSFVESV
ncbi:MAG: thioredoxin family protein, partial [Clostridia bacterium]|nr:thioredoxin family protein [Clostridia bacterium]